MATLEAALPMKKGVVIYEVFAADKEFGTHPKLFLVVILPYNS